MTGAVGAGLHYAVWVAVLLIVERVFASSDARGAYALLCAWWASLYIGYVADIGPAALPGVALIMLAGYAADINALTLTRAGLPSFSWVLSVLGAIQTLGLMSPIVVNTAVRATLRRLDRVRSDRR